MYSNTLMLLTLSATVALAHPHNSHHRFHYKGTGTGSGVAYPTGGQYDGGNGTDSSTGLETTAASPATITVSPLPAESTVDAAASSAAVSFSDDLDIVETGVAAVVDSTSTTCLSTSTETATSINYVTVTTTSSAETDVFSMQTTTIPSLALATSSVSLSTTGSVAAGEFFGMSRSHSQGASSVASVVSSVVPTTMATVVSSKGASSAASIASSSASTVASTTPSTGSSSGSKKGLAYNTASLTSLFSGASWAYNWAAGQDGTIASGLEYVPMLWGQSSVSAWSAAVSTAISNGATAVLSFNEPDLSSQSNIDPATAAQLHIDNMGPLAGKVSVGSPAITNGVSTDMGIAWLNSFFTACDGKCQVDFVAFHWYADATAYSNFEQHVEDVVAAAAANGVSKVWLTEFGASGTDEAVSSFLDQAIPYLEGNSAVERYAYFMVGEGTMLTNGALNTVGNAFIA